MQGARIKGGHNEANWPCGRLSKMIFFFFGGGGRGCYCGSEPQICHQTASFFSPSPSPPPPLACEALLLDPPHLALHGFGGFRV